MALRGQESTSQEASGHVGYTSIVALDEEILRSFRCLPARYWCGVHTCVKTTVYTIDEAGAIRDDLQEHHSRHNVSRDRVVITETTLKEH